MKLVFKIIIILFISTVFINEGYAQSGKINQYQKWKRVSILLKNVKDEGAIYIRLQDYDNAKHYIKSNYDISTYYLFLDKLDAYSTKLEQDLVKGFTFSKLYFFNSKSSKFVYKDDIESIEFRDGVSDSIYTFKSTIPHIYGEIKDLSTNKKSNPLNFSSPRMFQILDVKLQKTNELDVVQDFLYHEVKTEESCVHILQSAERLSSKLEELLNVSKQKIKRLERKIKSKHQEKINTYNKKIDLLEIEKSKTTDVNRKKKFSEEIEKYKVLIQNIKRIENEIF